MDFAKQYKKADLHSPVHPAIPRIIRAPKTVRHYISGTLFSFARCKHYLYCDSGPVIFVLRTNDETRS